MQLYDKTTDSAKHTIVNLNTKIKDSHIGDDMKKFGNKVADKSKEIGVNLHSLKIIRHFNFFLIKRK